MKHALAFSASYFAHPYKQFDLEKSIPAILAPLKHAKLHGIFISCDKPTLMGLEIQNFKFLKMSHFHISADSWHL